MTEQEKNKLRGFCTHLMTDFGYEFLPDDPVLPALYIIHMELNANNNGNKDVAVRIQHALAKLNPTVYNFIARGEAWKFNVAGSLKWLFIGLTVIGLFWSIVFSWRQYHPINQLLKRVQSDERGYLFLQFTEPKDSVIIIGKDYEKRDDGTVRVYLER